MHDIRTSTFTSTVHSVLHELLSLLEERLAQSAAIMSISVTAEDGTAVNTGRRLSAIEWGGDRRKSRMGSVALVDEAQEAADQERNMGVWQSIKTYPHAVGWSVLASTALVMEGYDLVVIGSFFGFRKFIPEVSTPT